LVAGILQYFLVASALVGGTIDLLILFMLYRILWPVNSPSTELAIGPDRDVRVNLPAYLCVHSVEELYRIIERGQDNPEAMAMIRNAFETPLITESMSHSLIDSFVNTNELIVFTEQARVKLNFKCETVETQTSESVPGDPIEVYAITEGSELPLLTSHDS
jgi:hypothetical protein